MSDYIYNISFVPLVDLTVVSGGSEIVLLKLLDVMYAYQAAFCEKEPQLCLQSLIAEL